jgi:hypothetical protein
MGDSLREQRLEDEVVETDQRRYQDRREDEGGETQPRR